MSSRAFTAGWLFSAALLSSWAVSSASEQPRPQPQPPGQPAAALPDLSVEVEAEIARLTTRMSVMAASLSPGRDPFRFTARRRPAGFAGAAAVSKSLSPSSDSVAGATAVSEFSSPSVSSEPRRADASDPESLREAGALPDAARQPTLSGIAELSAGAMTAVISFGGELHYARKGDVIVGRYRIDAITFDGADVFDLVLGTISRLKLQA